jgi:uncharacterized peroxidase-related enzyme
MAWIESINEDDATGELKEIYDKIKKERGKISNVMKIHSLNPRIMEKHLNLYLSIMFGVSDISRENRELIAVVISSINKCDYCINHHAKALDRYWKDREKIMKLINDFKSIKFTEKITAMLNYVYNLTKNPNKITKNDVDLIKNMGYSDRDILDINLIVSYFNFVNRIVLGLGVEFSEDEMKGYKY